MWKPCKALRVSLFLGFGNTLNSSDFVSKESTMPPPKKPKCEEDTSQNSPSIKNSRDDDSQDEDMGNQSSGSEDSGDLLFGHIRDKSIRQQHHKYLQHVEASDGFDVDFLPTGAGMFAMIKPIEFTGNGDHGRTGKCTKFAIDLYNRLKKPKSQLQLLEIEKANRTSSALSSYFITFRAVDTVSDQTDTYQTEVHYDIPEDHMVLRLFRKKGKKKGMLFLADFEDKEDFDRIEKCAHAAIAEHNKEQKGMGQLQLVRIVKAAFRETTCLRTYYITLEAMDTKSGQTDLYVAKMYYAYEIDFMQKELFRPKGEKKVLWSDDDEDEDDD